VHADDFNGTTLDLDRWTPCFSWASSYAGCTYSFNNGRERYQPSQVRLSGGAAHLVAEPVPGGDGGNPPKTYRSGLLSTTNRPSGTGRPGSLFAFRYGYVEARLRVPDERGFFTAFWMLPPDPGRYDYPYEIDILEALGGEGIAHMTLHHSNRSSWYSPNSRGGNGACPTFDMAAGYHTYGLDWQPSHIAFYIDGVECGRFTGPVWNGDMELILNLMVDVDWQRSVGLGLVDPTARATLSVDHIRVWQRS
jgi:beta-glucanase (GH16 family)